jgi:hypothetical protein
VWQVTLKHDIEEQAVELSMVDNNLSKNANEQTEIVTSILEFLHSVQDTDSSDEYIRLVFDYLRLTRATLMNSTSEPIEGD